MCTAGRCGACRGRKGSEAGEGEPRIVCSERDTENQSQTTRGCASILRPFGCVGLFYILTTPVSSLSIAERIVRLVDRIENCRSSTGRSYTTAISPSSCYFALLVFRGTNFFKILRRREVSRLDHALVLYSFLFPPDALQPTYLLIASLYLGTIFFFRLFIKKFPTYSPLFP